MKINLLACIFFFLILFLIQLINRKKDQNENEKIIVIKINKKIRLNQVKFRLLSIIKYFYTCRNIFKKK